MDTSKGTIVGGIAVVIAVIALIVGMRGPTSVVLPSNDGLGGQRGGMQEFVDGIKAGDRTSIWRTGTIPASTNQSAWCNTQIGKTAYVDIAEMSFTGNASSSMRVSIGTSTASSITNNYTAPYAGLVDNYLLATSTGSTIVANNIIDNGTNGRGIVGVATSECVNFIFRQDSTGACTGSLCEAATSTARGFNGAWNLRIHY
jgi:hypothetical protein